MQISETKVNELTKKHISRLLRRMEDEFDAPYWLKQLVKKEFWLFNQNLKEELFKNEVLKLDDKRKPWIPEVVERSMLGSVGIVVKTPEDAQKYGHPIGSILEIKNGTSEVWREPC